MPPTVLLKQAIDHLPCDMGAMQAEAHAEGHRFLERLAVDWEAGTTRFDRDGEMLLCAYVDSLLAGIGGLTHDPVVSGALRMRRFYVRPPFRRHGVGRRLAEALLERPIRVGRTVLINAAPASIAFWEALGFFADPRDGHTHILRRSPIGMLSDD